MFKYSLSKSKTQQSSKIFKNRDKSLVIITLLYLLLINNAYAYTVSDFKPSILKPSPPSAFHNVDTGL